MKSENYCIIMAGGVGSRFWPLSRQQKPKQFLDILGTGRTLIQMTYDRFEPLFAPENFFIVTNAEYKELVHEQLPDVPTGNILAEPSRRNTAPCIAYANSRIASICPNANIVVTPADHLVLDTEKFRNVITKGLNFTREKRALLTLGMFPTRPETGYGYIQAEQNELEIKEVKVFTEKPLLEMAVKMVESGEFYWNAGIFIWTLRSIEEAFKSYLPDIEALFAQGKIHWNTKEEEAFIEQTYAVCRSISVDIGIMEKADNVFVYCTAFGWSDLGTWGSLYENSDKNQENNAVIKGSFISYNSTNCVISASKNKLVVAEDLDDYIIADSDDVLLICKKSNEQNIKNIVSTVKRDLGESYI